MNEYIERLGSAFYSLLSCIWYIFLFRYKHGIRIANGRRQS
jgi:hypothetical protein